MITDTELKKLEKLSRLTFSDQEINVFFSKLQSVVNMIDQLQQIECDDVQPLRSVCEMHQRMTEDEVTIGDISDDLFKNVPGNNADFAKEIKCFIVPKVIE